MKEESILAIREFLLRKQFRLPKVDEELTDEQIWMAAEIFLTMPTDNSSFLTPRGDYKNLIAFQKSECIYDITYYFLEHYLPKIGDRTVDQMKQAARSGKQNIAEGNETGTTSMEACIKLVNVAKASLKELQEDYEDYLRNHGNQIWNVNSEQCCNARLVCRQHSKTEDYQRVCMPFSEKCERKTAIGVMRFRNFFVPLHRN